MALDRPNILLDGHISGLRYQACKKVGSINLETVCKETDYSFIFDLVIYFQLNDENISNFAYIH